MSKNMNGCKLTYHGQVLCCHRHRTFEENLAACKAAISMLELTDPFATYQVDDTKTATDFDEFGGTIQRYTAIGVGVGA